MTAIEAGRPAVKGSARRFYTVMAATIAVVVAAGFGPSYTSSLAPPGLPWWVHLHGAAMTAWITLFAVQAWLVGRRDLKLHRNLGFGGLALAVAIVPLGFATTMLCARRGATPPFFTPAQMMADDMVDVLVFLALVSAAVVLRRRGEWHKRLLLCATVLLSWPAMGRLVGHWGHSLAAVIPVSTALLLALALVGPIYDFVTRRTVHPAYAWGIGAIVLAQLVHTLLAASAPMAALAHWLAA
jgi:hypothetical protein